MLRLLCVTAHPDDEAGGFGGTLFQYAERGVDTYVVCLTDGQAASNRGGARDGAQLGAMRRREFAASCELLKVRQHEILGLPDGALDREPFVEVVGSLVSRIRRIRPHVMLTFGTEGAFTAHPDHTMASIFATAAFHWAGRSNRFSEPMGSEIAPWSTQKLYYSTSLISMPGRQPTTPAPWTARVQLDEAALQSKRKAFAAHTTQNPLLEIFDEALRQHGSEELYHLANSNLRGPVLMESDLFTGIEEVP